MDTNSESNEYPFGQSSPGVMSSLQCFPNGIFTN